MNYQIKWIDRQPRLDVVTILAEAIKLAMLTWGIWVVMKAMFPMSVVGM
jgi:hypothetical protein